jgi:hypothetical protein
VMSITGLKSVDVDILGTLLVRISGLSFIPHDKYGRHFQKSWCFFQFLCGK